MAEPSQLGVGSRFDWWPKPPHGPWGWSGHPQWPNLEKKKKKKKKKKKNRLALGGGPKKEKKKFVWPLGVVRPPPRAMRWLRPPHTDRSGEARVAEATLRPNWSGPATTKGQTIFFFFSYWGWWTISNGYGVALATSDRPTPNWGGQLSFNFYFIF
jgi:hypothetical protein